MDLLDLCGLDTSTGGCLLLAVLGDEVFHRLGDDIVDAVLRIPAEQVARLVDVGDAPVAVLVAFAIEFLTGDADDLGSRRVTFLASDDEAQGAARMVRGTYQSPILVQWRPADGRARRLEVTVYALG